MPARQSASLRATAERARALYAAGAKVEDILDATGLEGRALYYWLAGGPDEGEGRLPPITLRSETARGVSASPRSTRGGLIRRLWRTAERHVAEIETRLIAAGGDAAALEKDAKTLSVLARTVRDLVALEAERKRGAKAGMPDENTPDEVEPTRDIDSFRRELAAKLAELGRIENGAETAGKPQSGST